MGFIVTGDARSQNGCECLQNLRTPQAREPLSHLGVTGRFNVSEKVVH